MAKDKLDEIHEVVLFLKEKMIALTATVSDNHDELKGKLDGVNRRIDNEVDKRKTLDVRTTKLEEKVFGK